MSADFDLGAWIDEKVERAVERKLAELGVTDEWLNVEQAAALAKVSEWTIRQWAKQKKVESYQPNPGRPPLLILRSSLLRIHEAA